MYSLGLKYSITFIPMKFTVIFLLFIAASKGVIEKILTDKNNQVSLQLDIKTLVKLVSI